MIPGAALILLCQLAGEAVAHATGLPLPGPVLGMILLLALLLLNDASPRPVGDAFLAPAADGLLGNLSLLFIPAGVGVVGRLDVLQANGVGLAVALVASTLIGLVATALTFAAVARLLHQEAEA
ncbi:CidA/LrgA family protein [Roseomonas nepalensis]|uniref:CidA/LrgA family protein n=1 Tax=Muricoccus nepalensis TaxID=1854500 RepID=A0A502G8Z0_9PROT|nr:CidA/LrgA family protein [Roseomonas nepalensis]TPG58091.1 CidA/LrgA family protein [Roseomonas nepalensis]